MASSTSAASSSSCSAVTGRFLAADCIPATSLARTNGSRSPARGRLGGGEGSASESAQRGTGGDHHENGGDQQEHAAAPVDRRAPAASRRRDQREVAADRGLRLSFGTGIGDSCHGTALLCALLPRAPTIEPLFVEETTNACSSSRP